MQNQGLNLYQVAGMIRRLERKIDALMAHLGVKFEGKSTIKTAPKGLEGIPTANQILEEKGLKTETEEPIKK